MHAGKCGQALVLALLLVAPVIIAQPASKPMQSDWLELVKGSRDAGVGIQVIDIEDGDTDETQKITLAIPKTSIGNRDEIEEVLVIGRRPEKPEPVDITYEWVADYDNDNYGLVIRLGKNSNWPIRLFVDSSAGFISN
jgi:hypothetical protein